MNKIKNQIKISWYMYIYVVIFCLSIIVGVTLSHTYFNVFGIIRTIIAIIMVIALVTIIIRKGKIYDSNLIVNKRVGVITFCVIYLSWLVVFFVYYPGIFAYDVGNQMRQIVEHSYNIKHPILHTLLIELFYNFGERMDSHNLGIAFYSLFQMAVVDMILSSVLYYVYKRGINRWVYCGCVVFYAAMPFCSMLSVSVTKDVIFSGLFLLFCFFIYRLSNENNNSFLSYTYAAVVGILMCMFRNNAIYAVVLFGIVLFVMNLYKKTL